MRAAHPEKLLHQHTLLPYACFLRVNLGTSRHSSTLTLLGGPSCSRGTTSCSSSTSRGAACAAASPLLQLIEIGGDHIDLLMAHNQGRSAPPELADIAVQSARLRCTASKTMYFVNASTLFAPDCQSNRKSCAGSVFVSSSTLRDTQEADGVSQTQRTRRGTRWCSISCARRSQCVHSPHHRPEG